MVSFAKKVPSNIIVVRHQLKKRSHLRKNDKIKFDNVVKKKKKAKTYEKGIIFGRKTKYKKMHYLTMKFHDYR